MQFSELRRARQLASDLTSEGASLFDLLGKEVELKKIRNDALSRYLEISQVRVTDT